MGEQRLVALVTGASAGIGEAMAFDLARRGYDVALVARRKERIDRLADEIKRRGGNAIAVAADVTDEASLRNAVADTVSKLGGFDVVFANAGFGVAGKVERLTVDDYHRQFDTNVYGVIRTFHASLDALKKSRGSFGIVGSVNSYLALPGNSPYSASKFAVRALAVALRGEMRPYGVSVTLLCPGFVTSEIRRVDNRGKLQTAAKDPIPDWIQMPAETAARQMVTAVLRRRAEKTITFHGKIAVFLIRFFPSLVQWIIGRSGVSARKEPLAQN